MNSSATREPQRTTMPTPNPRSDRDIAPDEPGGVNGAVASSQRPRLIIADDDLVVQVLLRASLEQDFEVVGVAGDSDEAIELAQRTQPDVALVDVEMPRGGGLRAVTGIVDVAANTAIVMLSGDESDATVRDLIGAGAVAYCRKGIDPHELSQLLKGSIDVRARERERSRQPSAPPA
jgi:DNA-binding NarL/FixJ family response regulator